MAKIEDLPDGRKRWTCGQCGKSTESLPENEYTKGMVLFCRVCNCPDAADMTIAMLSQVESRLRK